jgi:hypothetical protein
MSGTLLFHRHLRPEKYLRSFSNPATQDYIKTLYYGLMVLGFTFTCKQSSKYVIVQLNALVINCIQFFYSTHYGYS